MKADRYRLLSLVKLVTIAWLSMFSVTSDAAEIASADDFLVVNCLLPGQVRQLGTRTTYVSARRPIKTTALDCRVRHGEYVLSDQADLRTALNVWLDHAKGGNPEAQTTVGEIFERGMGVAPDYEVAAMWYLRAAEAGFTRAQVNLGHLFERGLGMPESPEQALIWYRRAAGLEGGIDLDTNPDVAPVSAALERDVKQLNDQVKALEQYARELADDLAEAQGLLADRDQPDPPDPLIEEIATVDLDAPVPTPPARNLEVQLATLGEKVVEREMEIIALAGELRLVRDQLEMAMKQSDAMKLEVVFQNRATTQAEANENRVEKESAEQHRRLVATLENLESQEGVLAKRTDQVSKLQVEIEQLRQKARALPKISTPDPTAGVFAGPEITLIDPILPRARGLIKITVPVHQQTQRIIGRVVAPAGLLALAVNGIPTETNQAGVFITNLEQRNNEAEVLVTAIDQQGKRADLSFFIAPKTSESSEISQDDDSLTSIDFGQYHALLIGNNRHEYLPQLNTAIADVARAGEILRDRYGFTVHTLTNATRYEILSALNELRSRLTSADNLLIYYAGHGELDEVNMRGHWLPVDAEPENTANWISNVAITDILNVIQAKHVLLIADSCYSGTLTRSSIARQEVGLTRKERSEWLRLMNTKRARVVLTSGGLAPVLDAGSGAHSVFAKALIEVLQSNEGLLEGRSLFQAVAARVAYAAAGFEFEQVPQYSPVARAGHESGDFFLVPRS